MNHYTPYILASCLTLAGASASQAKLVAHFPMDIKGGAVKEIISGNTFSVKGQFTPENVAGAEGNALRFDGYTTHVNARINDIIPEGCQTMTVSMWVGLPCYPLIAADMETNEQIPLASCYDEASKSGFGFFIGFNGKWSFKTFVGGWPVTIGVNTPLPVNQWNCLTAVINGNDRKIYLYNNGELVGEGRCTGAPTIKQAPLYLGMGTESAKIGPFELKAFNGVIDEIKIWDEAIPASTIAGWKAENELDLHIPASRFANDNLRPRFHGMPEAAWTNETHGMTYYDNRYHVFFQKNANGPYMMRLHWGHISSPNLYDWTEEPIAIAPGEPYDMKGCWSGCVFSDDLITGGKPNILYTAVDYGHASICRATPDDNGLVKWTKTANNPLINNRPEGLSDDFRDVYFFRNGNNRYLIVGTSKDGIGATTLHRYDPATGGWSNNPGDIFFAGKSAAQAGTFWEMPNVTKIADDKWLFTVTPQNTSLGVRTLYWTGTIDADGRFQPLSNFTLPKGVELMSRHGLGLLSPTVYRHNSKVIALGIVPDVLPSDKNYELGWAHCYSLPREWSINDKGELQQRPASTLTGLRQNGGFSRENFNLNGSLDLTGVSGRQAELLGVFEVGSANVGFRIFKSANGEAVISYNPSTGELICDFRRMNRIVNDGPSFDGLYKASLPEFLTRGSELKLNVFIDHSILDIFVNDKWATSIRVFPTDADADGIEAFAEGDANVKSLKAWVLGGNNGSGVETIATDTTEIVDNNVYNLQGMVIRSNVSPQEALLELPAGIYIYNGKKHNITNF